MTIPVHLRKSIGFCLALLAATTLWLPALHIFFEPRREEYRADPVSSSPGPRPRAGHARLEGPGLPGTARALAARHLALWTNPRERAEEIRKMRASNAEWDFMARTFLVLSLANISLRGPSTKQQCVAAMDVIIDETLALERDQGRYHFLMPYARQGAFRSKAGRSVFLDGEIALMVAARRLVEEREALGPELARRVRAMEAQMRESPVLSAESYPDECWTFCNSIALCAMRAADALGGTDHSELLRAWIATARRRLVDPRTGLLISSFTFDGQARDGPEGSSIWPVAHFLRLVDPSFAADQYWRAKHELSGRTLGFAYAREWPDSWVGRADVDSGPIIPGLDISASSSGQALLGATTFEDWDYAAGLLTSLTLGGFPIRTNGTLRYAASNPVGDAVVLYALVHGPLWHEVEQRTEAQR